MASEGRGDAPYASSWLRRRGGRGNTSLLYRNIAIAGRDATAAQPDVFVFWFFDIPAPLEIAGNADLAQASNALAATGSLNITAAAALTQFAQSAVAGGLVRIIGNVTLSITPNVTTALGAVSIVGDAECVQPAQTLIAVGSVASELVPANAFTLIATLNTRGAYSGLKTRDIAAKIINRSIDVSFDSRTVAGILDALELAAAMNGRGSIAGGKARNISAALIGRKVRAGTEAHAVRGSLATRAITANL